jgi:hypothetical protein
MFIPAQLRRRATALLTLAALTGCDTAMRTLVGKPPGSEQSAPPAGPPAPPPNTAFVSDSDLAPGFTNQTIVPPTLPPDPREAADAGAEPIAAAGPHKAIASLPLSSDAAKLAELGAAANRERNSQDARFVLLVLTPPAADAAALDRANAAARLGADAALRALADAGIPSGNVDVSLATGVNVGDGELRLYRR